MNRCIVVLYVTIFVLLGSQAIAKGAPVADTRQALVRSIEILYSARDNIITNHEATRDSESSRWAEDEFLLFLSYIDGRILYYCEQLLQTGGEHALAGLPCPDRGSNSQDSLPQLLEDTDPLTGAEEAANIEADFQASLGQFDDYLLKEQDEARQRIPKQRETPTTTAMTDPRFRYPTNDETIKKSSVGAGQGSTETAPRTQPGGRSADKSSGVGSTRPTRTLPSSGNKEFSESDDDIVAKQLREAAEQETDPEIKARLWEEYYQYKEGIQ